MKVGNTVYFIESNDSIRSAEIIKISGDFVTLRYTYNDPHYINGGKHHISVNGGIRLRKCRLFSTEDEAKKYIIRRKDTSEKIMRSREEDRILNSIK